LSISKLCPFRPAGGSAEVQFNPQPWHVMHGVTGGGCCLTPKGKGVPQRQGLIRLSGAQVEGNLRTRPGKKGPSPSRSRSCSVLATFRNEREKDTEAVFFNEEVTGDTKALPYLRGCSKVSPVKEEKKELNQAKTSGSTPGESSGQSVLTHEGQETEPKEERTTFFS